MFEKWTADGKQASETSYYICNIDKKVGVSSHSLRVYWEIGNGSHWVMDVVVSEDHRHISPKCGRESEFLKTDCYHAAKRDTFKSSLKQKRKEAVWNTSFLETLLVD